jgi:hypothetical protein
MPTAEISSMAGVRAWAYLTTFICATMRRLVARPKRSVSRSSRPKARTSRAAARFSFNWDDISPELILHLAGAVHDLLAHIMHRQHGQGHDGQADEDGQRAVGGEGLPDEEAEGAEEGHGLLDAVVGDQGQGGLELGAVGDAAGQEVAAGFPLQERER